MKKTVILGIGNRLKGDDGAGSAAAEMLSLRGIPSVDGGIMPESWTGRIRQLSPDRLVVIDSSPMGLEAGEFRIIPVDKISGDDGFNSHNMSILGLIEYLGAFIGEIVFVGIEPDTVEFGEGLSKAVFEGVEKLTELIARDAVSEIIVI